jgi:nitrogen regulatory protein P-II 1
MSIAEEANRHDSASNGRLLAGNRPSPIYDTARSAAAISPSGNTPATFLGGCLPSMKKIEAIIKPGRLDELKDRLRQAGAQGITVSEVRGFGRTGGTKDAYLGAAQVGDFKPQVRIQMMIDDDMVQPIVDAIQATACRGEAGEGKIFVSHVVDAIRIRTGEHGHDAL